MKMQIQQQRLRLRLSEAELDGLLKTRACIDITTLSNTQTHQRCLQLSDSVIAPTAEFFSSCWKVVLPYADFAAFAAARPRRDSFRYSHVIDENTSLTIEIDIDVRDSRRRQLATDDERPAVG